MSIRLLTADTLGRAQAIADELGAALHSISYAHEKRPGRTPRRSTVRGDRRRPQRVAILSAAALGIAVLGPEGAPLHALAAADVVRTSVLDALALLHAPARITATLRP